MFAKRKSAPQDPPQNTPPDSGALAHARAKVDLDTRLAEVRAQYQEARNVYHQLRYSAPPRAELQAGIERLVDACATSWLAVNGARVLAALNPRRDPALAVLGADTPLQFGFLAATDRVGAIRAMSALLKQIEYEPGPASAEQAGRLDVARRAIEELEHEIWQLEAERSDEYARIYGRPSRLTLERPSIPRPEAGLISQPLRPRADLQQRISVKTTRGGSLIADETMLPNR